LKPGHSVSLDLALIAEELISKVLMASRLRPIRNAPLTKKPIRKKAIDPDKLKKPPKTALKPPLNKKNWKANQPHLIAIGASTGGPALLRYLFSQLPADYPIPITVVQHITPSFHGELLRIFNRVTPLSVVSPREGEKPQPGNIYLASPRAHLTINRNYRFRLVDGEPVDGHVPSATRLIESAAETYGSLALGMILTGMGTDGATGMRSLAERGGQVYILEEASCVVYGMPKAVLDEGVPAEALGKTDLAEVLLQVAGYQVATTTASITADHTD
ncbi:chemotaxis protein CheB, partial [bacterium]|nr:chemotaxis protein CheB [bacterium]